MILDMAAAHQRLRFLPTRQPPTRRDRTARNFRRRPIKALGVTAELAARRVPPAGDLAAVASDFLVVAALFERAFRRVLRGTDLNDLDVARALLVLGNRTRGSIHPSDLAELLAVSPATATRVLDRAEAAGFIDRRYPVNDRRTTMVVLTPDGEQARLRVLSLLRHAAAPTLGPHADVLADPLSAARATWKRRLNVGYGVRFLREAGREERRSA
jgi:DNA-binding MarR family transcriptional regulator